MKIMMRQFEFTCGHCGCIYRGMLPASSYGKLAFWDETGHYQAAFDAVGDPLFEQIERSFAEHPVASSVSSRRRGEFIQWVMTRLSDAAPNGACFDPAAKPACSHCGSSCPTDWRSVEPPETQEIDLPPLERSAWEQKSPERQAALLAVEVNNAFTR
jgi:hypothetical protein